MTYPEAIQFLESFVNYEKIPSYSYKESCTLERIKDFLKLIDDPQDSFKVIHIAGTKGKGSTCAFIAYILRQAGYKTGLYTSPHLYGFRERIRILTPKNYDSSPDKEFEGMISEEEIISLVERYRPLIENYNKDSTYGPLSFFEVYTTLAFVYFKEQNVDFAVLETGLGGRLDATNVVNPLVCVITPLSYEHTDKLGKTLKEIASEKAGIIKNHKAIVITAPQESQAMEVIRRRSKEVDAKLYEVGKDIFYEKSINGFNLLGLYGEYPNMEIRLLGEHQFINASLAIAAIETLRSYDIIVGIDSIRAGLYNTVWPGRCEIVSNEPLIILDGAQNIASAQALKKVIEDKFFTYASSVAPRAHKRLILVLGISSDKDIKGVCHELNDLTDEVILTKANNSRATDPKILCEYFKNKKTFITDSVKQAKAKALAIARKDDLILVTGSLFVVGEFKNG